LRRVEVTGKVAVRRRRRYYSKAARCGYGAVHLSCSPEDPMRKLDLAALRVETFDLVTGYGGGDVGAVRYGTGVGPTCEGTCGATCYGCPTQGAECPSVGPQTCYELVCNTE
jgi:hypothetical protein